MGFVADITDRIDRKGTNVLAVRVSAEYDKLTPPGKPQERMDFYYYSGIYRDVRMVITDKIYITDPLQEDIVAGGGQFVTFPEVSRRKGNGARGYPCAQLDRRGCGASTAVSIVRFYRQGGSGGNDPTCRESTEGTDCGTGFRSSVSGSLASLSSLPLHLAHAGAERHSSRR